MDGWIVDCSRKFQVEYKHRDCLSWQGVLQSSVATVLPSNELFSQPVTIEGNVLSPVMKFLDFPATHIVKPIVKRVDRLVTDRTQSVVKGIYIAAKDIHDLVDDNTRDLVKASPAASHKNLLRQNKELEDRLRFVEELRESETATRKKTEAEVTRQRSRANQAESNLALMKKQLKEEKRKSLKSAKSAKTDLDNEKKALRATISRLERRIELLELELRAQKAEAKVETEKNVYLKRCLEESKETQKSSESEARTLRSRLLQQSEKIAELDEFLRRAKAAAEESERSRREASNELNECRRFLGSMDGKRMQKIEAELAETKLALVQSRAREDELEMMVQQMTGHIQADPPNRKPWRVLLGVLEILPQPYHHHNICE